MPNYEWRCPKCGSTVNQLMAYRDLEKRKKKPPVCEACKTKMEYQFPAPAGRVIP